MVLFGTMTALSESPAATTATSGLRLANFNTFNPKTSLHFAETYVFRPKQLSQFGELFVVLQIDHATKTSPQVGDAVATILNHEYFRGNPSNVVQNMEDALHKTNEILSDLAARGEIHWIGKLHGVIGVFQKDAIHLSATGRGKAFLVRDGEIAEVTDGLYDSSRAASPMKTFENLASGELREGDTVIMVTPGVTDYLSPDTLRNMLEKSDPTEAVRMIQGRVGHDSSLANAAVVFTYSKHAVTAAPIASAPAPSPSVPSSDEPRVRSYMPVPRVALSHAQNQAEAPALDHESMAPVAPAIQSTKTETTKAKAGSKAGSLATRIRRAFSGLSTTLSSAMPGRGRRKNPGTAGVVRSAESKSAPERLEKPIKVGSLWTRIKKAVIRMPGRVKVFGALALLLVIVFVVSLIVFTGIRSSRADQQQVTDKFNQAKKLEEQAAAAIIFHDLTSAQTQLKQADSLIAELPQGDLAAGDLDTLKTNIAKDYEKLSGSVRIQDPTKLASVSGDPVGLALLDGRLVSWNTGGKLEIVSLKDGDTAVGATIDSDLGQPLVGAVNETQLALITDKDKVVGFEDGKLDELDMGGSFSPDKIVGAETYGNRLYTLDPSADEIMRHQKTIAGYGQGTSWILDGTSVKKGIDLAIDGNVWVLMTDGTVTKFLQGSKEDFTLGPVVDPLESPTRIVTSEDSKYLYILEPKKKRMLQFDKEKGDFVKQFVSDKFDDLRDMVVIEKGAKAYLLNGSSVFAIDLNK